MRTRAGMRQTTAMRQITPYERFLLRERHYCEYEMCLEQGKVVRKIDNRDQVRCWQHDPEQIQDFISWLESRHDSIIPDSFSEWVQQNEDSICVK